LSFCRAAATPLRPPLGLLSLRAEAQKMRNLKDSTFKPRVSSKLGRSPQTLGNEKLGGCGADNAATTSESAIATTMGFVIGICQRTAVGRENTHLKSSTAKLLKTSIRKLSSQKQGCRMNPRRTARNTCNKRNLGTATTRSKTQSIGARTAEATTQSGCTSMDQNSEEVPPDSSSPTGSDGPKARCTHVELAMPNSTEETEERFSNCPVTVGVVPRLPWKPEDPRWAMQM